MNRRTDAANHADSAGEPGAPPRAGVLICAHNPRADALGRVLEALRRQTLPTSEWELLMVDNASAEPLADRFDLSWHSKARHFSEPQLGKTHALLHGIVQSAASIIIVVDDDNILNPDYLQKAVEIADQYPGLGAWGGQVHLQFESPPPPWTARYWAFLAQQVVQHDQIVCNRELTPPLPVGAGCCVRREVALQYRKRVLDSSLGLDLDRKGASLVSAGDTDLVLTACDMGLSRGLFKALQLTHLIPAERLQESYLLRLVEGVVYSGYVLRLSRNLGTPPPAISCWWWLKCLAGCVGRVGRRRRFFLANKKAQHRARQLYESLQRAHA